MLVRVRRTIGEHALVAPEDRVLVAISGGADSTALALLFTRFAHRLGVTTVGFAHLNHQLRPSAADDEAFCRALAVKLGVPLEAGGADIQEEARRQKTSIEDTARSVRYAFLNAAADRVGATRIAVAQTLNDQAETVLLRLFRGAGPVGLAGIFPRVGRVVRPLLDVTRSEVERFLTDQGQAWCEDPSNRDVSIPRNWIRHELMPRLLSQLGGGLVDVLARQASLFRDDAEYLEAKATEIAGRLVLPREGQFEVPVRELADVPAALRGRVVLGALRAAAGGRFVGFAHVDKVLGLIATGAGQELPAAVDLPGQRVELVGDRLVFRPSPPDPGRAGRRRGRPAE